MYYLESEEPRNKMSSLPSSLSLYTPCVCFVLTESELRAALKPILPELPLSAADSETQHGPGSHKARPNSLKLISASSEAGSAVPGFHQRETGPSLQHKQI